MSDNAEVLASLAIICFTIIIIKCIHLMRDVLIEDDDDQDDEPPAPTQPQWSWTSVKTTPAGGAAETKENPT